jgi:tetratricopeptide (TPR) repeat protein
MSNLQSHIDDNMSFIDSYFNGQLPAAGKEAFEDRCASDPVFAEEVAFYISARDGLKKQLYEQKKKEFAGLYRQLSEQKASSKGLPGKIMLFAATAAACFLIFLGWQLFFKMPSAQKQAEQYIETNLDKLSKTMSSGADSMQLGITAFNNKEYPKAEAIFQQLLKNKPSDPDLLKYLGIVYLKTNQYDKALVQFEALSRTQLYANTGPFYQALTLLKRSAKGDKEKAKLLLQEVVQKGLPGEKEAEKWRESIR